MSKIVISSSEVESVSLPADALSSPKLPKAMPVWLRLSLLPLVLVLPLLATVALVMRFTLRASAPRKRDAWHTYLMTLLIASSFVFMIAAVLAFSYMPSPPQAVSAGIPELDERTEFPVLPHMTAMTGKEVGQDLRPLVMVASPAGRRWFGKGLAATNMIGAAVLLQANEDGYLFATAGHVAETLHNRAKLGQKVLLTTGIGSWTGADVIGWHRTADLALLWISRHSGHGGFVQPLETGDNLVPGESVYAIGHPEGLNFTISNGIISRTDGDTVQISAPVSPGNSGGPVYDDHGNLVGVVIAKMDRTVAPNAENLNFAASAALLGRLNGWSFLADGQKRLSDFISAQKSEPERKKDKEH